MKELAMISFKLGLVAMTVATMAGCSDGSEKLGVSEKRFEQWAVQSKATPAEKRQVKRLLTTATRSREIAQGIEDAKRRELVERRVDREVRIMMKAMGNRGESLFDEAGFSADGSEK